MNTSDDREKKAHPVHPQTPVAHPATSQRDKERAAKEKDPTEVDQTDTPFDSTGTAQDVQAANLITDPAQKLPVIPGETDGEGNPATYREPAQINPIRPNSVVQPGDESGKSPDEKRREAAEKEAEKQRAAAERETRAADRAADKEQDKLNKELNK